MKKRRMKINEERKRGRTGCRWKMEEKKMKKKQDKTKEKEEGEEAEDEENEEGKGRIRSEIGRKEEKDERRG